jgi:hypothetical protein
MHRLLAGAWTALRCLVRLRVLHVLARDVATPAGNPRSAGADSCWSVNFHICAADETLELNVLDYFGSTVGTATVTLVATHVRYPWVQFQHRDTVILTIFTCSQTWAFCLVHSKHVAT